MDAKTSKPILALLVPIAVVPALVILIVAVKLVLTGLGSGIPESKALDLLAAPKVSTVMRSEPPGDVVSGASISSDQFGNLLVGWAYNIVDVRTRQEMLAAGDPLVTSFAATPEGLVIAVRADKLGYVAGGAVVERVALPSAALRLERIADDRLCLYGPVVSTKTWAVYMLAAGGTYSKLFTFPGEITAVTGAENGLLFAGMGGIYRVEFGKRVVPILYLPARPGILSLAYDAKRRAVFFSTRDAVYVALEGRLVKLLDRISGTLSLRHDGLYILSADRQELLKVEGIFKT